LLERNAERRKIWVGAMRTTEGGKNSLYERAAPEPSVIIPIKSIKTMFG
jgi:hypothetical protein